MLLAYLYTYPNAKLRYYVGNMQLYVESDVAYLVPPGAKSRIAGYFYPHSPPGTHKTYAKGYNAPVHVDWLRDQEAQQQSKIKWDKGIHNMADDFTKHPPTFISEIKTP